MRYFLITGFECGKPIEPYIVETDADFPEMRFHSSRFYDSVRYYEQITKEEADEHVKNGIIIW